MISTTSSIRPSPLWLNCRSKERHLKVASTRQLEMAGAQEPECTAVHEDSEHRPNQDHGLRSTFKYVITTPSLFVREYRPYTRAFHRSIR